MYQALYRKWRPQIFDDVIGQDHITKTLKNEIISNRISHAYLFTGSRGTGKTSCAKILAKAINCLNPINGNPCRSCDICRSIENESMLDIVEIDAASNNGVENIRTMKEEVVFSPTKCKFRVYIVDEVHMLSIGAFNAFLKILEEPPPHVIFILATTEVNKLPVTIISRCQRFDFYRITPENICKRIKYICEKESIEIEDSASKLISRASDGAMRDALSILDQCANACKNNIREYSVKNILGISGKEHISNLMDCIIQGNASECISLINELYYQSKNMLRLCEELMEHFRQLMISNISKEKNIELLSNIEISNLNLENILSSLDILQNSYKNMNLGTDRKIEMEIALVKLSKIVFAEKSHRHESDTNTISDINLKKNNEKASLNKILENSKENFLESWPQILEILGKDSSLKSLYISLKDSNAYKHGNYILIDSKSSVAFELLRKSEYRASIKKIIKDITGKQYSLGPYNKEYKNSENNITNQSDPLDELIKNAQNQNINIVLN